MPATAMVRSVMAPQRFLKGCRRYTGGDSVSPLDIVRDLIGEGYERVYSVEGKGQLALRGGILDIFPPSADTPFRLEFAFDEIESIRTFDVESQVSLDQVTEILVTRPPTLRTGATGFGGTGLRGQRHHSDYLESGGLFMVDRIGKCGDVVSEFEKVGAEIASARMIAGTMGAREASVYLPSAFVLDLFAKAHVMFSLVLSATEGVSYREIVEPDTSTQVDLRGGGPIFSRK